jgi:hypothetical protein
LDLQLRNRSQSPGDQFSIVYAPSNVKLCFGSWLVSNPKGHFVVHLLESSSSEVLVAEKFLDNKLTIQQAKILHHAGADKLIQTLVSAGAQRSDVSDIVQQVTLSCEVCIQHGHPTSRPIVSAPLSCKFNDVVAIDIAYFEKQPFLKVIDVFSRFAVAVAIPDKNPRSMIDSSWFTYFGPMQRILADHK